MADQEECIERYQWRRYHSGSDHGRQTEDSAPVLNMHAASEPTMIQTNAAAPN
jgi:hypothetical protein